MSDELGRPWKVVFGGPKRSHGVPRIVDRWGQPVVSFGNQRKHRGHKWAEMVANLIVGAVNQHYRSLQDRDR
jgi:hypothetical protein